MSKNHFHRIGLSYPIQNFSGFTIIELLISTTILACVNRHLNTQLSCFYGHISLEGSNERINPIIDAGKKSRHYRARNYPCLPT